MTKVVKDITIRAPPERVFRALTDPQERAKWIESMRESGSSAPLSLGARVEGRRTAAGSRSVYHLTVRRLESPRALEMDIDRNGERAGRAGYELAPAPEGTRVRAWAEAQLKGLQKLAAPVVSAGLEKELQVDIISLKKFVEG